MALGIHKEKSSKWFPIYDAMLIDEAQDLPESFLKICYGICKKPKRIIYAYDELQRLDKGTSLKNPKEIFGVEAEDTILKKCYRNSRPVLVTAHALGFGIYRTEGLVQFFDQPQLWKDVGYEVVEGKLEDGHNVVMERNHSSSPKYLESHSDIDDLIVFKSFDTSEKQAKWVADEIEKNIKSDELLHSDIIVINPEAVTTKKEVSMIREVLYTKGFHSHIAGEFNADIFSKEGSITFTGIFRAKGNEGCMVYVINAQDCYSSPLRNLDLIRKRNTLFTAITRTKGWIRVCGIGQKMNQLINEYEEVKKRNFQLHFNYPAKEDIKRMNIIHRDLSASQQKSLKEDIENLMKIVRKIKSGESYIEDYPEELREALKDLLK